MQVDLNKSSQSASMVQVDLNKRSQNPNMLDNKKEVKQYYLNKKISNLDKNIFYEYLSIMLDGGVGIIDSLNSAGKRGKNAYFKEQLKDLSVFLMSGDSLNKAMKKSPRVFSKFEYSLIEAGENSGTLIESLENLSYIFKKKYLLRQKLIAALTYPIIIFIVLILAIVVVMLVVIPQIKGLFESAGIDFPVSTQMLILTSNFISNNFLAIIFFFLFIWFLIYAYKSTSRGKYDFEILLFSSPLIGDVYKNYILTGISANIGNLLSSGVSILNTLELVGKSTNSIVYEELFQKIRKKVSLGEKIVDSMRDVDKEDLFFPHDFLQMLQVGEKTASIGKISRKITSQYEREVDFSLSNLTKWIEPVFILLAGSFVLWFAFAIFGAILKITDAI